MILGILGLPSAAFAHSVETDYFLTPKSELEFQVKFSSGEPFHDAQVQVYAPNEPSKPWMEAKTNAEGNFAFQPDKSVQGDWTVKIGELEHSDILTVPVTQQGVNVDQISERPDNPKGTNQFVVLGFMIVSGGIGTRLLSYLKKRG
jgi:nickel transport protein